MTLLTVTAEKSSPDAYAGVGFTRDDKHSPLILATIDSFGIFGRTPLIPGLVVQKINGENMMWEHPRKAAEEIMNSIGSVSITAEGFVAIVRKSRKTPTGLVLRDTKDGAIVIADIKEDSMFASSELEIGMQLLTINNKPCPKPAWRTVHCLQRTAGRVKVVAAARHRRGMYPCWKIPMLEPESTDSIPLPPRATSPPPLVEDAMSYLPTLYDQLCGSSEEQPSSSMENTSGPNKGILRRRKEAPTWEEGDDGQQTRESKKSVRFDRSKSTTLEYDPGSQPAGKDLSLDETDSEIATINLVVEDDVSQLSGWSF
eukprot:scaffold981_cov119-Cylindrotheca_fusiformis.AAC.3